MTEASYQCVEFETEGWNDTMTGDETQDHIVVLYLQGGI